MIDEFIRVALAAGLTGHESHRQRSVHWFIDLDENGRARAFSSTTRTFTNSRGELVERRGKTFIVSANYHMQWKDETIQSVGTNQHNWLPDFLTGPVDEIFNDGVDGKSNQRHKRRLFWRVVFDAHRELPQNKIIRAIWLFVKSRPKFLAMPLPPDAQNNLDWFRKKPTRDGETISFRVNGCIAVSDYELRRWWAAYVDKQREAVINHLQHGQDAYADGEGPIAEYFPSVFGGVPFASFNKAPFVSFGLGSQTATLRLETAEKSAAGLNALLNNPNTSLQLGDETAVFWAIDKDSGHQLSVDFLQLMERPDPLAVRDYLRRIWGGRPLQITTADFHVAILLKGTGRFSVRSWHTDTLGNADKHLRNYFSAVSLGEKGEQTPFLGQLAWATIPRVRGQTSSPPPTTYTELFESALFGKPVPHQLFASALNRQKTELAGTDANTKQFAERLVARTAFIKLYFAINKNGDPMKEDHPAYLCGRLLAILDKIHNEAHDNKSASSPANRYYGAASTTPALAFPQLCKLARYHLNKLSSYDRERFEFGVPAEKRADDSQKNFEGLATVVAQLNQVADGHFPRMLALEDQGRFAIGFYYERERCKIWPHFRKRTETTTT